LQPLALGIQIGGISGQSRSKTDNSIEVKSKHNAHTAISYSIIRFYP